MFRLQNALLVVFSVSKNLKNILLIIINAPTCMQCQCLSYPPVYMYFESHKYKSLSVLNFAEGGIPIEICETDYSILDS